MDTSPGIQRVLSPQITWEENRTFKTRVSVNSPFSLSSASWHANQALGGQIHRRRGYMAYCLHSTPHCIPSYCDPETQWEFLKSSVKQSCNHVSTNTIDMPGVPLASECQKSILW